METGQRLERLDCCGCTSIADADLPCLGTVQEHIAQREGEIAELEQQEAE